MVFACAVSKTDQLRNCATNHSRCWCKRCLSTCHEPLSTIQPNLAVWLVGITDILLNQTFNVLQHFQTLQLQLVSADAAESNQADDCLQQFCWNQHLVGLTGLVAAPPLALTVLVVVSVVGVVVVVVLVMVRQPRLGLFVYMIGRLGRLGRPRRL